MAEEAVKQEEGNVSDLPAQAKTQKWLNNATITLIRVCRIKAEPLSDKLFSHFEHD
jgi:hypothetical protein